MGNEFNDFEMEAPTLTLEPELDEPAKKSEPIQEKIPNRRFLFFLRQRKSWLMILQQRLTLRIQIRFSSTELERRKKWRISQMRQWRM